MSGNGHYRRGSLVWPLVLVGAGVVFLLDNLGLITQDALSLLINMWPLLFIALGLDLLVGRRSGVGSLVVVVIVVALFAGGIWLFESAGNLWAGEQFNQAVEYPVGDAESAEVHINLNIGRLEIAAAPSESDFLLAGNIDIGEYEHLEEEFTVRDGVGNLQLSTEGTQYHPVWLFRNNEEREKLWELQLNPGIPTSLKLDTGVGEAFIDLRGTNLTYVDIDSGVGEVDVYLPAEGQFEVFVSAGVGKIEIYLPDSMAARIHLDAGLGETSVVGDFVQNNDVYSTSGFEEADEWIELYLDGGVGNISVVQIGN